ncbi:MAG: hypothetical protein CVV21_05170 [Candidatus Goldiibacteriota bacterium HGW-Goldbacteria-1]|jgi:hypothetical protein|nr:MAG: hypothetical protein CVV21_05170 [Candidatus Goldiibacteriota bacterium HGW-Goldbacteria-1]
MEKFELKDIVAIGRSYSEYEAIFGLDKIDMRAENVLDCGGGVSSFTHEASIKGINSISADRIYKFTHKELETKSADDLKIMFNSLSKTKHHYKWDYYKDETDLEKHRNFARDLFLKDYRENRGKKYITCNMPVSPFYDKEFTLALCSHFLFLYDEHLDYEFHRKAIEELVRVTKGTILIYPLINLRYRKSEFVDRIMKDVIFKNAEFEIIETEFEFLEGAKEVLKVSTG